MCDPVSFNVVLNFNFFYLLHLVIFEAFDASNNAHFFSAQIKFGMVLYLKRTNTFLLKALCSNFTKLKHITFLKLYNPLITVLMLNLIKRL